MTTEIAFPTAEEIKWPPGAFCAVPRTNKGRTVLIGHDFYRSAPERWPKAPLQRIDSNGDDMPSSLVGQVSSLTEQHHDN